MPVAYSFTTLKQLLTSRRPFKSRINSFFRLVWNCRRQSCQAIIMCAAVLINCETYWTPDNFVPINVSVWLITRYSSAFAFRISSTLKINQWLKSIPCFRNIHTVMLYRTVCVILTWTTLAYIPPVPFHNGASTILVQWNIFVRLQKYAAGLIKKYLPLKPRVCTSMW